MSKISAAIINWIRLKTQASAPSTPAAGFGYLYMKTDKKIYILNEDGTETCLSDAFSNPMTTEGDIIYGGASGVPTRLAKGTEDYVLTMGASVPEWAAAPGGGGFSTGDIQMVELFRETLAAAGRFDTDGTDLSGYDHLLIRLLARSSVAATYDTGYLLFNNDSTAGNYKSEYRSTYNTTTSANNADTPRCCDLVGATGRANNAALVEILIPNYAGTTWEKISRCTSGLRFGDGAGDLLIVDYTHHWESTSAITRVQLQPDGYATDNLAAGSFLQVLGIKTVS